MRITKMSSDTDCFTYIELRDREKDLWAVMASGNRLSKDLQWDYEPLPSSRTQEWIDNHSFTFPEARELLERIESGDL